MVKIQIEKITKTCYNFITPGNDSFFVYDKNIRRAKKHFINSFRLHGVKCIKFEEVKK